MKRLSFTLVLVLSFGFVTTCLAMGKLDTQDVVEPTQEVAQEAETGLVSEAYTASVDIEEVEDSMEMEIEPTQEVVVETETAVASQTYAATVEMDDVEPIQEVVVETETAVASQTYAATVEMDDVEPIQEVVVETETADAWQTYTATVEMDDVEPVQEVVVETETAVASDVGIVEAIIEESKALGGPTTEKIAFLLTRANELYSSKQFQNVVDVAQYILNYLDEDTQAAKDLITKAKDALVTAASDKLEEVETGISEKWSIFSGQETTE